MTPSLACRHPAMHASIAQPARTVSDRIIGERQERWRHHRLQQVVTEKTRTNACWMGVTAGQSTFSTCYTLGPQWFAALAAKSFHTSPTQKSISKRKPVKTFRSKLIGTQTLNNFYKP